MKKNRKIFRWGVFLLLCLLAATLPAAIVYRCHTVSLSQCDELYRKYVDNPGIRASFIKDFPVNDTLAVDVLLLEATSDSAWCALLLDFGASEELIDLYRSEKNLLVGEGYHSGMVFYIDINNSKNRLPPDNPDSRLVIGSLAKRSLCVFMTADTQFKELIFYNELDKTIHHEQNN